MEEVVEAPIPGKILSVNVEEGGSVEEGAVVCVIEAMKMENPILAPVGGSVKEITVSSGDTVQAGAKIAAIDHS